MSVVLPMRNRADVVAEALTSVLQQSYANLEVIVVDDASTDSSVSEVERVADQRVRIVQNDREQSAAGARNAGIHHSTARYLAFQDSDDWWHPDKLSVQMRVLTDPSNATVAVVGCDWRLMRAGERLRNAVTSPSTRMHQRNDVLDGVLTGVIGTPMLVVDRDRCAGAPLFDTAFPSLEERDWVYQLLPDGDATLAIVEAELVDVRRGRTDHVANPTGSLVGYERFLSKYATELASRPSTADWYHYKAMREALILRNGETAAAHLRAIGKQSPLLRVEFWLGRTVGYYGLAIATRCHLRPALATR